MDFIKGETDSLSGWWETSTGVEFGKEKLETIRELFKKDQDEK